MDAPGGENLAERPHRIKSDDRDYLFHAKTYFSQKKDEINLLFQERKDRDGSRAAVEEER